MNLPTKTVPPFFQTATKEHYLLLCEASLEHANIVNTTYGAIPIFGAVIDISNTLNIIQWPFHMPFPPESLKTFVFKSIYEQIDALKAMAICSEVEIRLNHNKAPALQIELSHRHGMAMKAYRGLTSDAWAAESGIDYFQVNRR